MKPVLCSLAAFPLVFLFAANVTHVNFIDIAAESGVTAPNTFGGKDRKTSILESTGTGVAIFDYDGDGANDIFIANGTTFSPPTPAPGSQLYHNDGKGHFTEAGGQAGLT